MENATLTPSSTRALDWLRSRVPRPGMSNGDGSHKRGSFPKLLGSRLSLPHLPMPNLNRNGSGNGRAGAPAPSQVGCAMCGLWYFSASGATSECPRCRSQELTLSPAAQVWVLNGFSYDRLAAITYLTIRAPEGSNLYQRNLADAQRKAEEAGGEKREVDTSGFKASYDGDSEMGILDPFCTSWEQIEADLPRTVPPESPLTTPMRRLLRAYALYCPVVGYCQGMSYVAAFLFATSGVSEREAFWMFAALMDNYGLKALYLPELRRLRCLCHQLDCAARDSKVDAGGAWMAQHHVDSLLFAASSVQTLFADGRIMSPEAIALVWDCLICDGMRSAALPPEERDTAPTLAVRTYALIIRLLLAMMRRTAPRLVGASFEEGLSLMQCFTHLRLQDPAETKKLIEEALDIELSYADLAAYERDFIATDGARRRR